MMDCWDETRMQHLLWHTWTSSCCSWIRCKERRSCRWREVGVLNTDPHCRNTFGMFFFLSKYNQPIPEQGGGANPKTSANGPINRQTDTRKARQTHRKTGSTPVSQRWSYPPRFGQYGPGGGANGGAAEGQCGPRGKPGPCSSEDSRNMPQRCRHSAPRSASLLSRHLLKPASPGPRGCPSARLNTTPKTPFKPNCHCLNQ